MTIYLDLCIDKGEIPVVGSWKELSIYIFLVQFFPPEVVHPAILFSEAKRFVRQSENYDRQCLSCKDLTDDTQRLLMNIYLTLLFSDSFISTRIVILYKYDYCSHSTVQGPSANSPRSRSSVQCHMVYRSKHLARVSAEFLISRKLLGNVGALFFLVLFLLCFCFFLVWLGLFSSPMSLNSALLVLKAIFIRS